MNFPVTTDGLDDVEKAHIGTLAKMAGVSADEMTKRLLSQEMQRHAEAAIDDDLQMGLLGPQTQ